MNVLKAGQIVRQKTTSSLNFSLPPGLVLVWCSFEHEGVAWVVEANPEKVRELVKTISSNLTGFQFLKYVFSREGAESEKSLALEKALETELKDKKIKVEGKLIRSGSLQGVLDFENKRLRVEKKIKVMIVDDSKTIRDLLSSIFSKDPELEVVATVDHPGKAQKLIRELKPDVITLDIHMPDMDGVTLLRSYLPLHPIPTVMISSITMEDGPLVLNALESGAVDYIQKPSFSELAHLAPIMVEKIKEASRSKVKVGKTSERKKAVYSGKVDERALVAIGSSTGGTEALKEVFLSMPASIPPVLVVQHIPAVFSKAFADRLNQICEFEIKEAEDGDLVKANRVLIAPGGRQMEVVMEKGMLKVKITDAPPMNRHKPSVDYLFSSLVTCAKEFNLVTVMLTGMGADGAKGMKALHDEGAKTIAQDEATSVVFGMPKEAIRTGAVESILPLNEIGAKIMSLVKNS